MSVLEKLGLKKPTPEVRKPEKAPANSNLDALYASVLKHFEHSLQIRPDKKDPTKKRAYVNFKNVGPDDYDVILSVPLTNNETVPQTPSDVRLELERFVPAANRSVTIPESYTITRNDKGEYNKIWSSHSLLEVAFPRTRTKKALYSILCEVASPFAHRYISSNSEFK